MNAEPDSPLARWVTFCHCRNGATKSSFYPATRNIRRSAQHQCTNASSCAGSILDSRCIEPVSTIELEEEDKQFDSLLFLAPMPSNAILCVCIERVARVHRVHRVHRVVSRAWHGASAALMYTIGNVYAFLPGSRPRPRPRQGANAGPSQACIVAPGALVAKRHCHSTSRRPLMHDAGGRRPRASARQLIPGLGSYRYSGASTSTNQVDHSSLRTRDAPCLCETGGRVSIFRASHGRGSEPSPVSTTFGTSNSTLATGYPNPMSCATRNPTGPTAVLDSLCSWGKSVSNCSAQRDAPPLSPTPTSHWHHDFKASVDHPA